MYTFRIRVAEIEGEITVLCNALLQAWCSQNVDIVESATRVLKYLVQAVRVIGRKDHDENMEYHGKSLSAWLL